MLLLRRLACSVLEDVEAFGISPYETIFDAVVDHLDEMSGVRSNSRLQ